MNLNNHKILSSKDITQTQNNVGLKTINLKRCIDWGFNVPDFIAITNEQCIRLFEDKNFLNNFCEEIPNAFKCALYAVRSSALIEDTDIQSHAGQFHTECGVTRENLSTSINNVLKQANEYLNGNLEQFSIIVQEFIEPDIAGVTFTRDPMGYPDMIIEYHRGRGEQLVSGLKKPNRLYYMRNQTIPNIFKKEGIDLGSFLKIEDLAGIPQDIEWCIKSGVMYILQSRTITTLTKYQRKQFQYLDQTLPSLTPFYFEKTEISEIAPRPAQLTYDLLQLLYSKGGPIDRVYKNYGISYTEQKFLLIIGNELFVDKEKELKSILPSFSYFSNGELRPKLRLGLDLLRTLKNIWGLSLQTNKINDTILNRIYNEIKIKIESPELHFEDPFEAISSFISDYNLIFEINLLSMAALKKLEFKLKTTSLTPNIVLKSAQKFLDNTQYCKISLNTESLLGNSLDIEDESPFLYTDILKECNSSEINLANRNIEEAARYSIILNRFREYGRWLTVIRINQIRSCLITAAKKEKYCDYHNIYFSTLEEIKNKTFNEQTCIKRRKEFNTYQIFKLTNRLSYVRSSSNSKPLGVSSGIAEGTILTFQDLECGKRGILYTDILSPNLVKYFEKLDGIVSQEGGMLSHLAILAREMKIPVIVNFSLTHEIKTGSHVIMNGDTGEIRKIN
jgi:phosphohistidine swiveling domain-containing protein